MPFVEWRPDPSPDPRDDVRFTGGFPLVFFSDTEFNAEPADACPTTAATTRSPAWRLAQHFAYRADDGRYYAVPIHSGPVRCPGHTTDLASVPPFLWSVLAPYGRQLRAALLHDHRCDVAEGKVPEDRKNLDADGNRVRATREPETIRREADDLFREALAADGVGVAKRWLFWTGVSLGRSWRYRKVRTGILGLLLIVQTCIAIRAAALAVGGVLPGLDGCVTDPAFWVGVVAVVLLLVVLQPRAAPVSGGAVAGLLLLLLSVTRTDSGTPTLGCLAALAGVNLVAIAAIGWSASGGRVALIAMLAAPVIAPLAVATLFVQVLLVIPEQVGWRRHGSVGPGPTPRPTSLR